MYTRIFLSLLLLALVAGTDAALAQSRVGTSAATFLTIGAGARGSSLGHAYTASATGADALFWNPAGAARPVASGHRGSLMFTHHDWFAGVDYNAAGAVIPVMASGAVGLSVIQLDYGDQKLRTIDFPEGTGEIFDATDLAIGVSYAQPLTPTFYMGGTAKYIRQSIRDMAASTFAFDLGFVLETRYLNGIRLAASIMNFGGKMQMDGINAEEYIDIAPETNFNADNIPARIQMDRWDLPLAFKFGVAVPAVRAGNVELDLLADSQQTNDNNLNADVGAALRYATRTLTLEVRSGYRDVGLDNVDSHLSYGAGLDLRVSALRFGFDFGYIPFDHLGDTRLIDFRLNF